MGGKGSGNPNAKPPSNGRPKGAKNIYTSDVKQMVLDALHERGGKDFFKTLDDATFARVATKLVPQIIDANVKGEMNVTVEIVKLSDGKK